MRTPRALVLGSLLCVPFAWASPALAQSETEKQGTFEGFWVATGERHGVEFPPGREAFVFRLEGSFNVKSGSGAVTDFWSTCVGLRDTGAGAWARCDWENAHGDHIYSEFTSSTETDPEVATGRFISGTGELEGIEGGYTFSWSTLFFEERDKRLSGFVRGIKGDWRLP